MPRDPLPLIADFRPEATLAYCEGNALSQRAFLSAVKQLSRQIPAGGAVINLCRDRYQFMLGFCAAIIRGSVSLLPPNRQAQTIRDIAADYPGSVCLVDGIFELDLPAIDITRPVAAQVAMPEMPLVPAAQLAAIAFTSGSTGRPTPNPKPWGTLCGTAAMLAQRFIPGDQFPTVVATVPSQHMYGLEMTVMLALQGVCAIASSHPFYAKDLAATLAAVPRPSLLVTTPIHLRHLVAGTLEMPKVGRIVSATAPLHRDLALAAEATFNASVEEIFGCTEAGSMATRNSVTEEDWRLLDGMHISEEGGDIVVRGPQLEGVTPLQDRLEILSPARFRFIGRAADTINVGGKRASLADLTIKLLALDGVLDGVVFMPPGEEQRPAALVVTELDVRRVLGQLSRRVDPVLLPRPLKKVASIPRNETGKTTAALLQQALDQSNGD